MTSAKKEITLGPERPRFVALESIRGLAALLVVFFHVPQWHPFLQAGFLRNSYLMVELFFVLSGFVIYTAYSDRLNSPRDLLRFQFLRFGRLYPVHILFLMAFLAIEIAKYLAMTRLGIESPNSKPFHENSFQAFVENILLINSVLPNRTLTFNTPAWSISTEFYTYLTFGVTALLSKRKEWWFTAIAIASLCMLFFHTTFGVLNLVRCLAGFYIGCMTAWLVSTKRPELPRSLPPFILLMMLLFLCLKNPASTAADPVIYFLSSALIISLVSSSQGYVGRALQSRVLVWLGTISYSLYMSHAAVLWVANQAVRFLFKMPEAIATDGASTPQLPLDLSILLCTASLLVTVATSFLVYLFVEKPLRAWSRKAAEKLF